MSKRWSLLASDSTVQQVNDLARHWGYKGRRHAMDVIERCVTRVHAEEIPAPGLVDTLKWVKEYLETTWDTDGPVYKRISAAIAQAEQPGRQKTEGRNESIE